LSSSSLTLEFI